MSNYILGIDVSNNNSSIDFEKVVAAGVEIVYLKSSEGTTFTDSTMIDFYTRAKAQGLKVGAYHFFTSADPQTQAQHFYDCIKDYEWDCIPMLDVETEFDGISDAVITCRETFQSLCDWTLGLYTYTGFLDNIANAIDSIKDMPLWEANYNNNPWMLPGNDYIIRVGHQYTETGNIDGVGKCDVDSFIEDIYLTTIVGTWIKGTGENSDKRWYKHSDGSYTKADWEKINGEWYYFDINGWMCTGWIIVKEKDYLLFSNGVMAHDCDLYGYHFSSNGVATKIN